MYMPIITGSSIYALLFFNVVALAIRIYICV